MLFLQACQAIGSRLSKLSSCATIALGLVTVSLSPVRASQATHSQPQQENANFSSMSLAQSGTGAIADGTYLYGQSPVADELGQEYVVFQVKEDRVVGAVYLPQSEFSCFSGTIDAKQMNLSVRDPYDSSVYSYEIALQDSSPVASGDKLPRSVGLQGYYPISEISDRDRNLIDRCMDVVGE
jgi:hypothetical protein